MAYGPENQGADVLNLPGILEVKEKTTSTLVLHIRKVDNKDEVQEKMCLF